MRVVAMVAVAVLAGCTAPATDPPPAVAAQIDPHSFCAGRMGHEPGSPKYRACVNAQQGANNVAAERMRGPYSGVQPSSYPLPVAASMVSLPPPAPISTQTRQATTALDDADKVWGNCVFGNARKLAVASHESAEAVVSASLARCIEVEQAADAAWRAQGGQSGETASMRDAAVRSLAINVVVTIRARRGL